MGIEDFSFTPIDPAGGDIPKWERNLENIESRLEKNHKYEIADFGGGLFYIALKQGYHHNILPEPLAAGLYKLSKTHNIIDSPVPLLNSGIGGAVYTQGLIVRTELKQKPSTSEK